MVKRENIYLITGHDATAKDKVLEDIKAKYLCQKTAQFNLDTLYAGDIGLKDLQEHLLYHPASSAKRMLVVKQAGLLKRTARNTLKNTSRTLYQESFW